MSRAAHWKTTVLAVLSGGAIVLTCLGVQWFQERSASLLEIGAAVGTLIAILSVVLRAPPLSEHDQHLQAELQEIDAQRKTLEETQARFAELQQTFDVELKRRSHLLDDREQHLSNRLVAYQEWLEYPAPGESTTDADSGTTQHDRVTTSPAELNDLDRQVMKLLDAEAQRLYEKLREGYYKPEGKLDTQRIRDDIDRLVTGVARVYRPDVENPLLETSAEQLLRAASRSCLHILIVLERLPLNLKDESFSTLHGYVQKAVKAFDAYSSAEPYLGYASKAMYFGRFVAGANPLTLGVTWALTELGKRGAKAIGQKLIDEQAVSLLGDLVRVIGFEVAGIYGGDFRHRDRNWIYGSELTELMSRFPVSRENLAHSLREIGGLTLRNEYDRIYLYRCLSSHRAANPLVNAAELLAPIERQAIARQLEVVYRNFVHGRTQKRVDEWRDGVELRLGTRLVIDVPAEAARAHSSSPGSAGVSSDPAASKLQEVETVLRSLAGLAAGIKGRPVESLREWFPRLESLSDVSEATRQELFSELLLSPPQFFDPPDIDPDGPLIAGYLTDVCRLAVRMPPLEIQSDALVLETAAYFGVDVRKLQQQLDGEYVAMIRERFPNTLPSAKLSPEFSRSIAATLEPDEQLCLAYPSVKPEWPVGLTIPDGDFGLISTNLRLLLLSESDPHWGATSPLAGLSAAKVDGMIIDDCRLTGAAWSLPGSDTTSHIAITIPGTAMKRYDSCFAPLLETVRNSSHN